MKQCAFHFRYSLDAELRSTNWMQCHRSHSPIKCFLLDQGSLWVLVVLLNTLLLPHHLRCLGTNCCLNVIGVDIIKPKVISAKKNTGLRISRVKDTSANICVLT